MRDNDHRAIGNRMDLFHFQEEAPGMAFWHPRGFAIYRIIEDAIRKRMRAAGFGEVRTPQVLDRALWEASGHWQKFGDNMFTLAGAPAERALKPMSCPGHVQIFKKRLRSVHDLPLRFAEFGACLRNEPSGALLGLMRTQAFVQDDAHIFCTEDQMEAEIVRFCQLLQAVYADFGFDDYAVALATRPAERAGSDAVWDEAERRLAEAADAAGLAFDVKAGEGAFYGPKLEFILRDNRGRAWQCGTVQADLVLPERLDASYMDADNRRRRPVMLHQAVLGSVERFIGMLLEHHNGNLSLWLAPDQIVVAAIGAQQNGYCAAVADRLGAWGYRVQCDTRPERLAKKIVDARQAGIPILLAVGAREAEAGTVSLRWPDGRQAAMDLDGVHAALKATAFR